MRICNECEVRKPLVEFHRGQYKCKPCSNRVVNEYRKLRRRLDEDYRVADNRMKSHWAKQRPGQAAARQRRYFARHKHKMTRSWIVSGLRKKFGRQLVITEEMIASARRRISAIRSQKFFQLSAIDKL